MTSWIIVGFHGYCSPWRCLRRLNNPKGTAKYKTIAKILVVKLNIAFKAAINFEVIGNLSLHPERPMMCALIQLMKLRVIDTTRRNIVLEDSSIPIVCKISLIMSLKKLWTSSWVGISRNIVVNPSLVLVSEYANPSQLVNCLQTKFKFDVIANESFCLFPFFNNRLIIWIFLSFHFHVSQSDF